MAKKIMTLHPEGKKGVNIDASKYKEIRTAILAEIKKEKQIPYQEVSRRLEKKLTDFEGSVRWYVVSVKLDLEARNIIERVPKTSPHEIRLVK